MHRLSGAAILIACMVGCTVSRLPALEIAQFGEAAQTELSFCAAKGLVSLLDGNRSVIELKMVELQRLHKTDTYLIALVAAVFDPRQAAPFVEVMQRETQSCEEAARKRVEPYWPKALAAAESEAEKKLLRDYYDSWDTALRAQKPEFKDFVFKNVSLIGVAYKKRVNDARERSRDLWKAILLAKMSREEFCLKELSSYSEKSDQSVTRRAAIRASIDSFDVSTDDLQSIDRGLLRVGMKKCAVMAIWGDATQTRSTTDRNGFRESWSYGKNRTVEFLNEAVISFSQ